MEIDMAEQDETQPRPELYADFLQQNLAALNNSAGQLRANAMYEAGRKVGQVEGQQLLLANMVKMFGPEAVAKAADSPPLKLAEGEDTPADG